MPDTQPPAYRRPAPATQPAYDSPAYGSTHLRHPKAPLLRMPHTLSEVTGPRMSQGAYPAEADMTRLPNGRVVMGERIIIGGRVLDEDGRPVPGAMLEVWQANAAGRYNHPRDTHDVPLDPDFTGRARVFADAEGRYSLTTIRPGAYPWRNHHNAWRPVHVHFSLFGAGFAQRLITQMYFPGDPLLALDPVFQATPDAAARDRLVAKFDLGLTVPEHALGYRFDIVLRGAAATPFEDAGHDDEGH
ncbi:protocatechuate 3,4-dioxygenase beta subunit [Humitalea rosea]|uniref:Protocatechuate 3,4-dioxygenase beta subunit n=1 Tax=Humitalea rosea TaxID=990373 RepID=A0A2W7I0H1_9PROT|nr:protocatechuate 3,4-dioxygenase subunit beta [Humitalea rosea]PZW39818.1 protocatechuate 3,4-dioxygenase beta subunit [Humitalea rosea]